MCRPILNNLKFLFTFFAVLIFSACKPSSKELLDRAMQEELMQRSQLAKYLYIQVVESHPTSDEIRFKALDGLANVLAGQLFDYPNALVAYETILRDYRSDTSRQPQLDEVRLKASRLARLNEQDYDRALKIVEPLLSRADELNSEQNSEIGLVYLNLHKYIESEEFLKKAWEQGRAAKQCDLLKSLQLALMQVNVLRKACDQSLSWSEVVFPEPCKPDESSVMLERANCLEITGEVAKAMEIYEGMIQKNPTNSRAHFLLEAIKKRQKDKSLK